MAHRTICALQQHQALEALAGDTGYSVPTTEGSGSGGTVRLPVGTEIGEGVSTGGGRDSAAFKPPPSAQVEMEQALFDDPFADPFVGGAGFSTNSLGGEGFAATRTRASSAAN